MTPLPLLLTLITTAIPLAVYFIHLHLRSHHLKTNSTKTAGVILDISIVISAYNEKSVHCQTLGHSGTGVILSK